MRLPSCEREVRRRRTGWWPRVRPTLARASSGPLCRRRTCKLIHDVDRRRLGLEGRFVLRGGEGDGEHGSRAWGGVEGDRAAMGGDEFGDDGEPKPGARAGVV